VTQTALKRIDDQLGRVKQLFGWGHIEPEEYFEERGQLNQEKQTLRDAASSHAKDSDLKLVRITDPRPAAGLGPGQQ